MIPPANRGPRESRSWLRPREVAAGRPFAGFDLERHDGAVVVLDDPVDFGAVAGPPVAQSHGLVEPGSLLADLPDDEGLQQVPEVGE
jgi:hypothetical protein